MSPANSSTTSGSSEPDPLRCPRSRGLDAWAPTADAWAFGVGVGVSIIGCGSVFQIRAFGAGFDSPTASGLVVVVEFGMFGSKKPIALGVFEYDFRTDAFVVVIQLDITLAELIDNFPEELDVTFTGALTFGNKPGLVALGRLGDAETWLGAKLEFELSQVLDLEVRLAVCVEWQQDEHVGGGFTLSIELTGSMGVIRLKGWGALEVLLRWMSTGTNDFVARVRAEFGFAVILFGFLRFGISLQFLAEWLAHQPNYLVFRVTFRFETPWFLPDVSYTLECVEGELEPAERTVVTGALLQAGAVAPGGAFTARVQRVDSGNGGEPTALVSVLQLIGSSGAWHGEAQPVPLDATVEIDFSVMLVDTPGIGSVNPDLGEQVSGDGDLTLTSRYTLIGLTMRRRPLTGGTWEMVEELTGPSSPRNFRWSWDDDTRIQRTGRPQEAPPQRTHAVRDRARQPDRRRRDPRGQPVLSVLPDPSARRRPLRFRRRPVRHRAHRFRSTVPLRGPGHAGAGAHPRACVHRPATAHVGGDHRTRRRLRPGGRTGRNGFRQR